jgi:membrane protease YdiL (CAAX protease family)
MNLIGWSLVIFLGLFSDLSILDTYVFSEILTGKLGTALSGLFSAAIYMAPFILGGVMFYIFNKKTPTQPIRYGLKLPAVTPLLIFAGLAMITAASYVNSWFCDLIGYSIPPEIMVPQGYDDPSAVIMYMTVALAPAFAEEFLFRGVIYGNLRPFGKTQAILISSLLFALMHQNIGQFFYTFVGGIAMAFMYELTGSIWCSIIYHMFNNEIAVLTEVLYYGKYGDAVEPLLMLWDALVLILGSVSIVLLVLYYHRKASKEKALEDASVFGCQSCTELAAFDGSVDRNTLIRGIKAPGIIVFVIMAIASAAATYLLIMFTDLEALL